MSLQIGLSDIKKEKAVDAKILRMREANEQRRQRFHNARDRIIGVDVAALDAQVRERKLNVMADADLERLEAIRFNHVAIMLEENAIQEKEMQKFQQEALKSSWDTAVDHKAAVNAIKDPMYDSHKTGKAAAQVFIGEDSDRVGRIKSQQHQIKKWQEEKMLERRALNEIEKEEEKAYSDMLDKISNARAENEREEIALRKSIQTSTNKENAILYRFNKQQAEAALKQSHIEDALGCLEIVDEEKENALGPDGRVSRRDHFKGYTEGQVRKILRDNMDIVARKNAEEDERKRMDSIWRLQQDIAGRAMELNAVEEAAIRMEQDQDRHATIAQQILEERERRSQSERNRFGSTSKEFFNKFGTSCR